YRGHRVLSQLRPLVPRLVDPARPHAGFARDALPVVQHAEPAPRDAARLRGPDGDARVRDRRCGLPRRWPAGVRLRDPARDPGHLPLQAPGPGEVEAEAGTRFGLAT